MVYTSVVKVKVCNRPFLFCNWQCLSFCCPSVHFLELSFDLLKPLGVCVIV